MFHRCGDGHIHTDTRRIEYTNAYIYIYIYEATVAAHDRASPRLLATDHDGGGRKGNGAACMSSLSVSVAFCEFEWPAVSIVTAFDGASLSSVSPHALLSRVGAASAPRGVG